MDASPRGIGSTATKRRSTRTTRTAKPKPKGAADERGIDTSFQLKLWLRKYRKTKRPVKVNFRRAVSWIPSGDRATHYIHPYPGKLLPQIAHFFTHASMLSMPGDVVLDPFAGTGTVSLEAVLAGRNAIAFDTNPLAVLVAAVKTRRISRRSLSVGMRRLNERLALRRLAPLPSVVNLNLWFEPKVVRSLRELLYAIEAERSIPIRNFLLVCFSVLCRRVSRCDPRLSVPVRLKKKRRKSSKTRQESPRKTFREVVKQNVERMREFTRLAGEDASSRVVCGDARRIMDKPRRGDVPEFQLQPESVQLIVSSPPYGGAQKYVRASSLSLGWLRLASVSGLRELEDKCIGREHFHKSRYTRLQQTQIPSADAILQKIARRDRLRACISGTYLREMHVACRQMTNALKPGGYLVLIIGNNMVTRLPFFTNRYLTKMLLQSGLELQARLIDDIRSRGLMTKRNRTASVISREWVLLFRKPNVA